MINRNIDFDSMDLSLQPPVKEPERQYYFIARLRQYVKAEGVRLGRSLTANVTTFGCQMNTEHEIEKAA